MKKRILLVEDDDAFRWILGRTLELAGYEVQTAAEGCAALKHFQQQPFDLVLTDLLMPGKEGLETIIELRQLKPQMKIIAMSGGGRTDAGEYLPMARGLGAIHTLTKPFSAKELLEVLSIHLKEEESTPPYSPQDGRIRNSIQPEL